MIDSLRGSLYEQFCGPLAKPIQSGQVSKLVFSQICFNYNYISQNYDVKLSVSELIKQASVLLDTHEQSLGDQG